MAMYDLLIQNMREEVTRLGAKELRTPEEVDDAFRTMKGTSLVVVNSTCGCAGGTARPGLSKALQHSVIPGRLLTVFAGQDREATDRAREYFTGQPPSSPSFVLMKDGEFVEMVHRYQIEGHTADQVTARLTAMFDRHCAVSAEEERR